MVDIDKTTQLYLNNEVQLFCFRLDEKHQRYGVNIYKVREVVRYEGLITKVNHNRASMLEGVITVRDETMPLIDLRKWFFYNPSLPTIDLTDKGVEGKEVLVMVCDFSDFVVGIRIYGADRIISKTWDEVNQNSEIGIKSNNAKITANTKYIDDSLLQIVDIEKMLVDTFPWIDEQKEEELEGLERISSDKEILLAEDSPIAMKIMQKILDKLGVNHKDFVNGRLLLNYLESKEESGEVGLVITDLEMPEASGFEVIKNIKSNKTLSHIPIVVNSSMSGDSNRNMAKKLNADGFVSKSNPREIEDAIKELML